jgi:3-oxo-5-alpha-steroid 4-dehydrogenase 1
MMEVVSPIAFLATILSKQLNHEQWILTSCWMLHYIHRSIVYPLRAPSMAPIHIFASFSAVLFNLLNGYTNAYFIGHHPGMNKAGLVVWAMGFASNVYHDNLLFQLRDKTGKANYFIPYGGLFAYVSCPNYFSEVVEWTGFAIAANPSVPACLFVAATLANLFPRAWRTHQWYKKQFKHYPSSRKAVVPFLF